jgi:hypothetical protein
MVDALEGRCVQGLELFAAVDTLRKQAGLAPPPWDLAEERQQIELIRSKLDEVEFNRAWQIGASTDIRTTIDGTLHRLGLTYPGAN